MEGEEGGPHPSTVCLLHTGSLRAYRYIWGYSLHRALGCQMDVSRSYHLSTGELANQEYLRYWQVVSLRQRLDVKPASGESAAVSAGLGAMWMGELGCSLASPRRLDGTGSRSEREDQGDVT